MFTYTIDEHTHLKLPQVHDAQEMFELVHEGRSYLREWLPWVDHNTKVEDSRSFIESTMKQYADNNGFQALIVYQGHIAGVVGMHHVDWNNRQTSLGYWLGEKYQGKGLMTKSVQAIVEYCFRECQLNRVEIRVAVENKKSQAIPERLGFTKEGILRQHEKIEDQYLDHIVYSMLMEEWRVNHHEQ